MFRLLSFAFGMVVALLLVARAIGPDHRVASQASNAVGADVAGQNAGPWSLHPSSNGGSGSYGSPQPLVLARDGSGQFHLIASVNGRETPFLVDTGADLVALTREEAGHLGIVPDEADYQPTLRTASGMAMGARVRLDRLEVAGHEMHDVDAVVVSQGLEMNLLGQSALRRLGKVELKGDTMVLDPE